MMKLPLMLSTMLCVSTVAGCVGEGDETYDLELRAAKNGPFWQPNPSYAGDGHVSLSRGGGDDDPDVIIWDLDGGNVAQRAQSGALDTRFVLAQNELHLVDAPIVNVPACTVVQGDHPSGKEFELVDSDGAVVFTLWKRYVFAGEVDIPSEDEPAFEQLVEDHVAFSFKKDQIYAGTWSDGELVAHASEEIAAASPMRRLVLAALVAGECQSGGMF